jgi:hypothetical protein
MERVLVVGPKDTIDMVDDLGAEGFEVVKTLHNSPEMKCGPVMKPSAQRHAPAQWLRQRPARGARRTRAVGGAGAPASRSVYMIGALHAHCVSRTHAMYLFLTEEQIELVLLYVTAHPAKGRLRRACLSKATAGSGLVPAIRVMPLAQSAWAA